MCTLKCMHMCVRMSTRVPATTRMRGEKGRWAGHQAQEVGRPGTLNLFCLGQLGGDNKNTMTFLLHHYK